MAHATQAATAASAAAAAADRRRVKVYELRNNDWYDRGTGFCTGQYVNQGDSQSESPDGRIVVISEDEPNRKLLETQITKDDGYQKQQDTLIVWTEHNGVDMALSFQEAEGCASIWDFVSEVQSRLAALAPDDGLSDDLLDMQTVSLPEPQLGRLEEVEAGMRTMTANGAAREQLGKWILQTEYITKLGALVERAEELESTNELHKLCIIMKHIILLNDSALIEFAVTDPAIMGVVGALEYDPDFPAHKANHRQWLSDTSRFKEVVPIVKEDIRQKIHWTYRLLYLKDVVLARILDDPTFSVLNGLIFFHQVDIVNHLQNTPEFLKDLFDIFAAAEDEKPEKKKEAVLFIQNCCAVSKNIQAPSRAQLYQNFIQHGLFTVITFALRHQDASVRVAGTDILVALIDHDPHLVRSNVFAAIKEKSVPLTDTLIELLLVEVDLGVKSQMADALKILLDPATNQIGMEMMNRTAAANPELAAKQRAAASAQAQQQAAQNPQTSAFIDSFYDSSAKRLFAPLKQLEHRQDMSKLTVQETSLYTHLVDVLCFFVRQHAYKSKLFILSENLHARVAQLLACPQKYMKLMALKWFRTCIGLQDEFHNRQMIQHSLFDPILGIVEETMPRDNLLNSACLELFEYIKREEIKQLILHLGESYRDRLMRISYVNTFQALVLKYEKLTTAYPVTNGSEDNSLAQEGTPHRMVNGRRSYAGLKGMDSEEEAYFEGDDDSDLEDEGLPLKVLVNEVVNGASPVRPLVSYPDDDDGEDNIDILASSPDREKEKKSSSSLSDDQRTLTDPTEDTLADPMDEDTLSSSPAEGEDRRGRDRKPVPVQGSPGKQDVTPEPLSTKRPREDDDEDELGKMMGGVKRRNSSASLNSKAARHQIDGAVNSPMASGEENGGHITNPQQAYGHSHGNSHILRRKGSLRTKNESPATLGKFAIKPIGQSTQDSDDIDELAGDGKEEDKQSTDPGGGGKGG